MIHNIITSFFWQYFSMVTKLLQRKQKCEAFIIFFEGENDGRERMKDGTFFAVLVLNLFFNLLNFYASDYSLCHRKNRSECTWNGFLELWKRKMYPYSTVLYKFRVIVVCGLSSINFNICPVSLCRTNYPCRRNILTLS